MPLTYTDSFALVNLALCAIKLTDKTMYFQTGTEASFEPVTSTGTRTELRVKNTIHAVNKTEDIVTGYIVTLKDAKFSPEIIAVLDGGKLTKDTKLSYTAALAGAPVARTPFTLEIYTEVKQGNTVTGYLKFSVPGCVGTPFKPTIKDGEFAAMDYTMSSEAPSGEPPLSFEELTELPAT